VPIALDLLLGAAILASQAGTRINHVGPPGVDPGAAFS